MKTVAIVVAHYSIELKWLKVLVAILSRYTIHIYIYSKGKSFPLLEEFPENVVYIKCTKRNNVGREGETFLHHIHHYYNNLEDYTLFLKDSLFREIRIESRSIESRMEVVVEMLNTSIKRGMMCNPTFYDIGWHETNGCLKDWTMNDYGPPHKQSANPFIKAKHRGVYNWTREILKSTKEKKKILDRIENGVNELICYTGIFAAKRSALLSNSRLMYTKFRNGLQYGDNIEAGHYMERLWGLVLKGADFRTIKKNHWSPFCLRRRLRSQTR